MKLPAAKPPDVPPILRRRTFTSYYGCADAWVRNCLFPRRTRYRHRPESSADGEYRSLKWETNCIYSYGSHFPIAIWMPLTVYDFHWTEANDEEGPGLTEPVTGVWIMNYNCESWIGSRGHSRTTRVHIEEVRHAILRSSKYGGPVAMLNYVAPEAMSDVARHNSYWAWIQSHINENAKQVADGVSSWVLPGNHLLQEIFSRISMEVCDVVLTSPRHRKEKVSLSERYLRCIRTHLKRFLPRLMDVRESVRKFFIQTSTPYSALQSRSAFFNIVDVTRPPSDDILLSSIPEDVRIQMNMIANNTNCLVVDSVAVTQSFNEGAYVSSLEYDSHYQFFRSMSATLVDIWRQHLVSPMKSETLEAYMMGFYDDHIGNYLIGFRRLKSAVLREEYNRRKREATAARKAFKILKDRECPFGDIVARRRPAIDLVEAAESESQPGPSYDNYIDSDRMAFAT